MELIKIGVFLCVGIVSGLYIPKASQKMIQYKCMKRYKEVPEFILTKFYKQLFLFLNAFLFAMAGWLMPLPGACIVCVFAFIAFVSIIIDKHIRIICNEAVLLILILGIAYRLIGGGVSSLLGSLAALGIVLAIFGGAALLTKLLTKDLGVGVGDVKLSIAIAITVGYPEVFYFLGGIAVAIGGYCLFGMMYHFLTRKSTFPMCGHIMFGFFVALFIPYIPLSLLSLIWG
jgi:leader peptidase (prepilin peptidase)/N-methyltransferase